MWAFLSEKAGPPPNTLNKEDKLKHLQRTQGRVISLDIWGTLTNKKKIKTFCNTSKKKPPTKEEKYLISVGKFLPSLINEEVKIKTIMWSLTTYHLEKKKKRLIIFHIVQGIWMWASWPLLVGRLLIFSWMVQSTMY